MLGRCLQQQRINERVNIIELRPWKLNVVNLPVRPVEYCRHPDGALKIYSNIEHGTQNLVLFYLRAGVPAFHLGDLDFPLPAWVGI